VAEPLSLEALQDASAKSEEGQNGTDDDNETNDIDDLIHDISPGGGVCPIGAGLKRQGHRRVSGRHRHDLAGEGRP
jgi:hypothetical protein